ncbi:MAG: tetratricopeptide repeat protein [Chthoniobacter sp.]|nr:tetratricopeptide repeat protein [Chthoniobacter sp.]
MTDPDNSARAAGQVMGTILFLIVPLVLNLAALRKDATNRKCVLAIIILLVSMLITSLGNAATKHMEPNPVLMIIPAALLLCGVVASTVLAIIGLVEFRARGHRHGRKRAITALVLSVVMVISLVAGLVAGLNARNRIPGLRPTGAPGQGVTREEWNFRITPPPEWASIEGSKVNPLARAAFVRTSPQLFSMILVEELPGVSLEDEAMIEIIKGGMRSKGEVTTITEGRKSAHGLDGLLLESEVRAGNMDFFFQHWVVQSRGFLYQLVTWGNGKVREPVRAAGESFRESFTILDTNRTAAVAPASAAAAFRSPAFGYSVDPTGTAWKRRWEALAKDSLGAEFGVQTASQQACAIVCPLWLGPSELDFATVSTVLSHAFVGVEPSDEVAGSRKDCTQGPFKGQAFVAERTVDGLSLEYHIRVLRSGDLACLLAAWRDKKIETRAEVLDEILDRVTFDATPPTPDLAKLDENFQRSHALVWNSLGLACDRAGQPAAALPWFQRAFEMGKPDAVILGNYMETCLKTGDVSTSLAFIDQHIAKFPGNQKLALKRANVQFASGDEEGGLKSFATLFDGGYRDDKFFTDYISELTARDRGDAALAALDRYSGAKPTPALSRLKANVHSGRHEHDQALAILTALQKTAPDDSETTLALADAYFNAQRHTEALTECAKLIAAKKDSAYVWRRKGFVEFSLKRYREAKASFEKAHEKDPPNTDIKRMLDHVSGMLGEGGNSLVKKAIEPVPFPVSLLAEPSADKAGTYLRGFSAYYIRSDRAIGFTKRGELKATDRQTVRVLDTQGVEKFSTIEIGFDPLSEEVFVNSLQVKNAAGEVVGTGSVDDSYVVDQGAGESATQRKILHVPVPGLQPGFSLEYVVTRRDTGTADSFHFQTHQFVRTLPALRSSLHVVAAREAVKWEGTAGVPAPKRDEGSITWVVEQPPVYRWEPLQAPGDTFLPMLWLGDAHATWAGEAKEYLTQIKEHLAVDAAIKTTATEVTKGLTKDTEKAAALARFVQDKLTYKAIEFGRRARIPATAVLTLRNKYGDCKDHALLLTQLLGSIGIPAHLALVNANDALRPGLPSLDQFDHMIVYLPSGKGGTFFDCTGKSGDLRASPPSGLATRQALILDSERPRLETIPDYPAGSSGVSAERDLTFPSETDLDVRENVSFTGYSASGMRNALQAVEAANRNRWLLHNMTREIPALDLRDAQIENVDDPQAPLRLKLHYVLPRRFQNASGQLIGQLPSVWERWFLAGDPVEVRQTPFKVWMPVNFESRITLTPPPGWQASAVRENQLDRPFCTGSVSSEITARKLRINSRVTRRAGQFSAGEYRAFLDANGSALGLFEQGIVLKKGGK